MSTVDVSRGAFAARLEQAERSMRGIASREHRSNWITLLLGLLVLGALSAYFWLGYSEINKFLQPDELVGVAQGLIDDNIPQARTELETQIKAAAPELAKSLSQQAMQAIPQGRVVLAETMVSKIKEGLEQTSMVTLEELRGFLRRHKDVIEHDLQTLSTNTTLAENEIEEMVKLLESEFGEDFRTRAFNLYETANAIQDHLDRLAAGTELSERDKAIRRLLTYVRRYLAEANGGQPLPRLNEAVSNLVKPAAEGEKPAE